MSRLPALFIGRFQPFHKGHLDAVKQMLRANRKIVIGVGSAQYAGTPANPFSASLRTWMIRRSLAEAGIAAKKFSIVKIPDIHDDTRWVTHVEKIAAPFAEVWSGTPKVQKLFRKNSNYAVVVPRFRTGVSGTVIRKRMHEKERWEHLVPAAVADIIKKLPPETAP